MLGTTIRQLANEIGVSKTAIRNKMDDDFREKHTFTDQRGVILIDYDGEIILKKAFNAHGNFAKSEKLSAESSGKSEKLFSGRTETVSENGVESGGNAENGAANTENVTIPRSVLTVLEEQLKEKDEQIRLLQQLLAQQQQLHARDQEKVLRLEDASADQESAATQEPGKKSFWSKWFK